MNELTIRTHIALTLLTSQLRTHLSSEVTDDRGEVSSYMILMAAIVAAAVIVAPQVAGVITDQGNAVATSAGGTPAAP